MKKILIAVLLCIPFLILATIDVSSFIISSAKPDISIEKIELINKDGEEAEYSVINVSEYLDSGKFFRLTPVIYPTIAKNLAVGWKSSNPKIATVTEGDVYFTGKGFGEVKITCYSKGNKNIFYTAIFFVTGTEVYSITLSPYEGTGKSLSLAVGEKAYIAREIAPGAAIKDKIIEWKSSDNNVITLDNNGIVTAKSIGTATVSATIIEKGKPITGSINVTVVASKAVFTQSEIYIAGNTLELSAYTSATDLTVKSGEGSILDGVLTYNGTEAGKVVVSSGSEEMIVNFTKGVYHLTFDNLDILKQTAWDLGAYLNIKVLDFSLTASVLEKDYFGTLPKINISSSDSSIIKIVDGGRLYGLVGGRSAKITASADGFVSAEITIDVKIAVEAVNLALDNDNDNQGTEGTVVFGDKFIDNVYTSLETQDWVWDPDAKMWNENANNIEVTYYTYTNTYKLNVKSVVPSNAEQVFIFKSSNTNYATVDNNGLITFLPAAVGNKVTISVYPKYTYGSASDEYTFSIVDGLNIGLDTQTSDDNPDYTPYYLMRSALEINKKVENQLNNTYCSEAQNVVLHSDVYFPSYPEEGSRLMGRDGYEINMHASIYGNGHKVDGRYFIQKYDDRMFSMRGNLDNGTLFMRNLILSCSEPLESEDDWQRLKDRGGFALRINLENDWEEKNRSAELKYLTIQNTFNSVVINNGKVIADGCLIKNTVSAGFMLSSGVGGTDTCPSYYPDLTISNSIFCNTLAPAIMILPEVMKSTSHYASLTLGNGIYIFNWKKIEQIQLDIIPSDVALSSLNNTINNEFKKILEDEQYDYVKIKSNDQGALRSQDYVNLGVIAFGAWYDGSQHKISFSDSEWTEFNCPIKSKGLSIIGNNPVYFITQTKDSSDNFPTMPNEEYTSAVDENGNPVWLNRLHGK